MRQRKRKWAQPYLDANEKYVIKDFPVTVAIDSLGNSLFER
jgi:tartrate dehydratase beta subunit/fumarate hydratase class I family protein